MDIFSNLMVIGECLLDKRRTLAFQKAIEKTVKPGDLVMDVGTGSSIMAMFAARAGAKKVYAVEIAEDVAQFARENVANNKLTDKIEVISADIKDFAFSHSIDVVIMELMDTGLVAEQEAVAMNALHKRGVITDKTKLIPYRYGCVVALAEYDFNFYGFYMPFVIQARNFLAQGNIKKPLSSNYVYADIDFSQLINTHIDRKFDLAVTETGKLNCLVLKAKIFLSPGQAIWGTTDLNMPVIIPIAEISVKRGDHVSVHISYEMGEGFGKFKASCQIV